MPDFTVLFEPDTSPPTHASLSHASLKPSSRKAQQEQQHCFNKCRQGRLQ